MKKILVASPVYNGMEYCFDDFVKRLKNLDYSNYDILIVDNSRNKTFYNKIKDIPDIKVLYDNTTEEKNLLRLISSRNKILDFAIENDYNYLLMMDSDVMIKENALNKLLSFDKNIVSGLYFSFFNVNGKPQLLPICYKKLEEEDFLKLKEKGLPSFVKSREDIRRNITKEEIENNDILEVLYPSGGCLLLSKDAFSSGARYGLLEDTNGLHTSDDIFFFKELIKKDFKLYCSPLVIGSHAIEEKYKDGKSEIFD